MILILRVYLRNNREGLAILKELLCGSRVIRLQSHDRRTNTSLSAHLTLHRRAQSLRSARPSSISAWTMPPSPTSWTLSRRTMRLPLMQTRSMRRSVPFWYAISPFFNVHRRGRNRARITALLSMDLQSAARFSRFGHPKSQPLVPQSPSSYLPL